MPFVVTDEVRDGVLQRRILGEQNSGLPSAIVAHLGVADAAV
jgi:hypothetical protein